MCTAQGQPYVLVGCVEAPPPPAPPNPCSVEVVSTDKAGYTTVKLKCELPEGATNVYAMAGVPHNPMSFPAAFQVPAPFGSDIGAPNPAFIAFNPDVAFDSYLTVGDENPDAGAVSTIGFDFSAWSESAGIDTTDGALFYMDPNNGAAAGGEPLTFAQLTLANADYAAGGTARAELQGRSLFGGDWEGHVVAWDW